MATASPALRVGTELAGRYRIERLLASGGQGALYAGVHLLMNRQVAIKVMLPRDDAVQLDVDRFLREARTTASLKHPNIVEVLDVGLDGDEPYLVMELLEGRPLSAALAEEGRLTPEQAFRWLSPIMGALAVAHDAGVVHRDIKPENIFLATGREGEVVPKLLDFGAAKTRGEVGLTKTGVTLGTPSFMSPEQAQAEKELTPASDVWSLGVVWFLCLSGEYPFVADEAVTLLVQVVTCTPPPLADRAPNVPIRLTEAIDRALDRSLARRYADMRGFCAALVESAVAEGVHVPASPDSVGLPAWNKWVQGAREETATRPAEGSSPQDATEPPSSPSASRGRWAIGIAVLGAAVALVWWLLRVEETAAPPFPVPSTVEPTEPQPVLESPGPDRRTPEGPGADRRTFAAPEVPPAQDKTDAAVPAPQPAVESAVEDVPQARVRPKKRRRNQRPKKPAPLAPLPDPEDEEVGIVPTFSD